MSNEAQVAAWVEDGLLEVSVDEFGDARYNITDKMRTLHPDMAKKWDDLASMSINSLWQKGLIEVEFCEDGQVISPTPAMADYDLGLLSRPERAILNSMMDWRMRSE